MKNAEDLLVEVKAAYDAAHRSHRDRMLEVGVRLHEYVLASLRENSDLSRVERKHSGAGERNAVKRAAEALGIKAKTVHTMIKAAMIVELLAPPGGIGELAYSTIWRFVGLIEVASDRDEDGKPIELRETWRIKAGLEEKAKSLFKRAVSERMPQTVAQVEVSRLLGKRWKPQRANLGSVPKKCRSEDDLSPLQSLKKQAQVATG